MSIYFAGAIRGGRDFQSVYKEIILKLQKFDTVLTEHIGSSDLKANGEEDFSDKEIYKRDKAWIEQAEFFVADVSSPSLGVGYELGLAESLGKKILCLYNKNSETKLSAMIAGNNSFKVHSYHMTKDLDEILHNFFTD